MINFKNKKILITGATGGIGGALVKKFSSLGGTILGTGTKPEKLNIIKNLLFINLKYSYKTKNSYRENWYPRS